MKDEHAKYAELTDEDLDDLTHRIDDSLLVPRMKNVVMGDVHSDPEGETVDEQSRLILATILRQLQANSPSRAALGYLSYCLQRHLSGEVASLDEAFNLKQKRRAGGQHVSEEVERRTVTAYMRVIRKHTWHFDSEFGCETYSVPSKAVKREACQAAFEAYRDAVGKDNDEFNDPEKKINQTIKPLLRRKGVLR
ncbi:hypothetical protein ACXZ1M_20470 [Duganella sp. PWIR1]